MSPLTALRLAQVLDVMGGRGGRYTHRRSSDLRGVLLRPTYRCPLLAHIIVAAIGMAIPTCAPMVRFGENGQADQLSGLYVNGVAPTAGRCTD